MCIFPLFTGISVLLTQHKVKFTQPFYSNISSIGQIIYFFFYSHMILNGKWSDFRFSKENFVCMFYAVRSRISLKL